MKQFVAFTCLLALVAAIDDVKVLSSENEVMIDGYKHSYELDNGQKVSANGKLFVFTDDEEGDSYSAIQGDGGFEYTAPDGQIIKVSYVADVFGFKPTGDHLPVAPEIPILIQRSIDYLKEHAPKAVTIDK